MLTFGSLEPIPQYARTRRFAHKDVGLIVSERHAVGEVNLVQQQFGATLLGVAQQPGHAQVVHTLFDKPAHMSGKVLVRTVLEACWRARQ